MASADRPGEAEAANELMRLAREIARHNRPRFRTPNMTHWCGATPSWKPPIRT
jgi:hypothetical protein